MRPVQSFIALGLCLGLSACSGFGPQPFNSQPMQTAPAPGAQTKVALTSTQLTDFIDAETVSALTEKEQAEAASAQYYALQFGRPGAPRLWQGDKGSSGKVTVGPYVRVNQLDCRDYVHEILTPNGLFKGAGTACREGDGRWAAVQRS